jgi:hypothetical protein
LNEGEKIFIIEMVLANDGQSNNHESVTDIQMMMVMRKRRNRKQFETLLENCRFRIENVKDIGFEQLIEAVAF